MAKVKHWSVQLERQPHRDALVRMRQAYRQLQQMSRQETTVATVDREPFRKELQDETCGLVRSGVNNPANR